MLQVIWAIGVSMIVLAPLIWLPRWAVLAIAAIIIAGHNTLDAIQSAQLGSFAGLWCLLHEPGTLAYGGHAWALEVYPVLPWLGVMALGYGFGPVFLEPPAKGDRTLLAAGIGMTVTFFILRAGRFYGDPLPWSLQSDAISSAMIFFNVQKYPPSLLYVCATLGPILICLPLIRRWQGRSAQFFRTFGAVPLFAYVVHLYLAHALSILLHLAFHRSISGQFDFARKMFLTPQVMQGSGLPLPLVYASWVLVVAVLYALCRWFSEIKQSRTQWWWSYL